MTAFTRVMLALLGLATGLPAATPSTDLGACTVFPSSNIWNVPVDTLPVHPSSRDWVNTVGATKTLHPDFGTQYGIPFVTVAGNQAKVPVRFSYSDESDAGPYPVPNGAPIEGGAASTGDRHVLVVDRDNCILYELYSAAPNADSSWSAGSGAVWDLRCNFLRPKGWTSADAAGLPVFPGLVRYDEVASGEIRHAIRFTVPQTQRAFVWPGRHFASSLENSKYPPMGARFRLKASFDISPYPPQVQVLLRCLKKYGLLLADNGSAWYLSGAPDSRWDDDDFHTLHQIAGGNLEAVDQSSLMVSENSGATH